MDAEQRLIFLLALLAVIVLAILGVVVLFALWPYRMLVSAVLFTLAVLLFLLVIGVTVNEQLLRWRRVKYKSELPLDREGHPLYLPQEMKPYRDARHE